MHAIQQCIKSSLDLIVTVDTAGAGEGALKVHISHDGREVPVEVFHEGRGMYRVNFTPDGGGLYTIRVYFAEMEVTGELQLLCLGEIQN